MRHQFVAVGDTVTDAFIRLREGVHVEHETTGDELCINFGEKLPYEEVTIVPAVGNSANAAVSAHRLGLTAALVSDIGGDDFGKGIMHAFESEGLDTSFVRVHNDMQSNYHYVLMFGAERTILIKHYPYPYALPDFAEPPEWLYFSSVGEHGLQYHHDIAAYCKAHSVKLAFQPGSFQIALGVDTIKDIYEMTEIFFCNKEEAQKITGDTTSDVSGLITKVRARGPRIACITDGPHGAFAGDHTGVWQVPMYPDPAPPKNRTGAGDAFASTVTAMLAVGMPLPDALIRGPINSMHVVQFVGAQKGLLTREQLEEYLKKAPAGYALTQIA